MSSSHPSAPQRTVSLVTLGCARNEVDSEELAGRLEAAGWTLTDRDEASVVLVNTCGFIEAAKQESIAELLDASGSPAKVVAAGCLAERYGTDLAEALPEAQVLSFDDYTDIGARLDAVLAGERRPARQPRDRRRLLPIAPAGALRRASAIRSAGGRDRKAPRNAGIAQNEQRRSQPEAILSGASGPPSSLRRSTRGPDAGATPGGRSGMPGPPGPGAPTAEPGTPGIAPVASDIGLGMPWPGTWPAPAPRRPAGAMGSSRRRSRG